MPPNGTVAAWPAEIRRPVTTRAARRLRRARDAQLHRAQRARALLLPFLPGTSARPAGAAPARSARRASPTRMAWRRACAARSSTGCSRRSTSARRRRPSAEDVAQRRTRAGCARRARRARGARGAAALGARHAARGTSCGRCCAARAGSIRSPSRSAPASRSSPACSTSSPASPTAALLVVDYKSDRVAPEEDLEAMVEREYSIQRLLYALAVLATARRGWRSSTGSCTVPPSRSAPSSPRRIGQRLEDAIAELVRNARARPFTVSENPHRGLCLTCPGRSGLCSWSDSDTLRERVGA